MQNLIRKYKNKLAIILTLCLFFNFLGLSNVSALKIEESAIQSIPGNTAVVYSLADFKSALASTTITIIHLGADITLDITGALISPQKPFLVIDGMNPYAENEENQAIVHRLTEFNSNTAAFTARLETNGTLKHISLQNIQITGYNFYGVICIYDTVTNVYVTLNNVYYEGPQPVYNRYGTTHFIDTTILLGNGYGGTFGEAAESANIILEGNVFIKQVTTNNTLSVLWLAYKLPGGIDGNITVLPGSKVDVTVNNSLAYFMSVTAGSEFIVGKNASFTFNGPSIFWLGIAPKLISINESAEVYINLANNNYNATVSSTGNITVEKDAVLQIISKVSTTYPMLSVGGSLTLNDPKSVILSRPNGYPLYYSATRTISIEAQQVNYWTTAGDGSSDDKPRYSWRKSDDSNIRISGSVIAGGNFSSIAHNYVIEQDTTNLSQLNAVPSTTTFNLLNARTIAIGRLPLTAEYRFSDGNEIVQGVTSPGAILELLKYSDLTDNYSLVDTAVTNTADYIITSSEILRDQDIKIKSYLPYFVSQQMFIATVKRYEVFINAELSTGWEDVKKMQGTVAVMFTGANSLVQTAFFNSQITRYSSTDLNYCILPLTVGDWTVLVNLPDGYSYTVFKNGEEANNYTLTMSEDDLENCSISIDITKEEHEIPWGKRILR